jgi:hypothetical protein
VLQSICDESACKNNINLLFAVLVGFTAAFVAVLPLDSGMDCPDKDSPLN